MLKSLLRVRFAALLAAFTGQSRKRGRQTKGKAAGYALLMLYCFCAFVFLFYSSFSQLAEAFFPAGLGWLYFAMFAIMAFALMFIGSVFTAKSQLFEAKDNELLLSMPVRPGLILLSRMAAMLAMNFVFELVVALPVLVAWLRYGSVSGTGVLSFIVIVLALPLFALAVSCLFAWLISLLTSRMRNTTVITMVLSVVFLLAYFVFCFRMNTYVTQLAANGQAATMTQPSVATDLHEALDVLRNLAVQVTFDGEVLVDVFADLLQIVFGDILDTDVRVNAGLCNDLLGGRVADAVNVGQTDLDALLAREVDAEKTSHGISSSLFFSPGAACDEGSRK